MSQQLRSSCCHASPRFLELGVLDALCGLDRLSTLSENELSSWVSTYQYCSTVFVLPPWDAIYVRNAERDHTFEHAEWVDSTVREWYRRCRYQLVEVPRVSVEERCAYVLQILA
jgi:predicted ATPase